MGGSPGRAATCALAGDVAREPQGPPGLHGERSTLVLAREALGPAASQPVAQDTTVSLAIELPMLLQAYKEFILGVHLAALGFFTSASVQACTA